VPRYFELALAYPEHWRAVQQLILEPLGVLHQEPDRLLMDDLRDTTQAASILALIGGGCHRLSEISARLQKPATSLTRPLRRLLNLGLVAKDQPFAAAAKSSKKSLYTIADPFLFFWFTFVEPNRSRLQSGRVETVLKEIQNNFSIHLGQIWERLARASVAQNNIAGIEWNVAQRWWGAGLDNKPFECDIVAESVDAQTLLVGEVKLTLTQKQYEATVNKLNRALELLPFAEKYAKVYPVVFVGDKSGLQESRSILLDAKDVFLKSDASS